MSERDVRQDTSHHLAVMYFHSNHHDVLVLLVSESIQTWYPTAFGSFN